MNFGVKRRKCQTFAKASYVGNNNVLNARVEFESYEHFLFSNFGGNGADYSTKCIDRKLERERNNIIIGIKKLNLIRKILIKSSMKMQLES